MDKNQKRGFTLLELLITISIIAILSLIIIFILNPAETLKKSRDAQRIADLATLKTALGLYLTASSTPDLDAATSVCFTSGGSSAMVSYSLEAADSSSCTADIVEGADAAGTFSTSDQCRYGGIGGAAGVVDGTGWTPVNLTVLTGGSPISNYPLDPTNTIASLTAPTSSDLVYRYVCQNSVTTAGKPSYLFELNAQLESAAYTSEDDRRAKDGGNNVNYYEVGNSLRLLGAGSNF